MRDSVRRRCSAAPQAGPFARPGQPWRSPRTSRCPSSTPGGASSLARARGSSQQLSGSPGLRSFALQRLNERHYGGLQGLNKAALPALRERGEALSAASLRQRRLQSTARSRLYILRTAPTGWDPPLPRFLAGEDLAEELRHPAAGNECLRSAASLQRPNVP